jgi:hypothetical protein
MRVKKIERHLCRIELEMVLVGKLEHTLVYDRIFVAGEADEADFTGFFGFEERF